MEILNIDLEKFYPHLIAAAVFVLATTGSIVLYFYDKRNNLFELQLSWKIPYKQVKIIRRLVDQGNSEVENRQKPAANFNSAENAEISTKAMISKRRVLGAYALIDKQRAEFIQFTQNKPIELDEKALSFLHSLKQIQHENLANMMGIQINDGPTLTIFHTLVERGTLEDFCLDPEYILNETFKSAFMRDILTGLQFIHRSPIKYHGFLQASTCLIDVNWVLKLALHGVTNFVSDLLDDNSIREVPKALPQLSLSQFARFPPEHLKEYDPQGLREPRMIRGSQKGDMYCIGMIFYMMIMRKDPFNLDRFSEKFRKDLIGKIINENEMPHVPEEYHVEGFILESCIKCWNRDPEQRPTFTQLRGAISIEYPSADGNLMDQMIRMNEKYAEELEGIVASRSAELAHVQEQTMRLLNEMLPASIAQALRNGKTVHPRSYKSATVMFVQICDFVIVMKRVTPDKVILFLNTVFDEFDEVISAHDAYKVETTGETYMVASGVPDENEGNHVFEVADISLEIREMAFKFVFKTVKDFKLRVRIGFHAGPIAAGVIGIRSPRYCLFGDTVNFASRMQSNCPPNQIQTSEITARMLLATDKYKLVKRGIVFVKGKGEVNCFWLNEHVHPEDYEHPEPKNH